MGCHGKFTGFLSHFANNLAYHSLYFCYLCLLSLLIQIVCILCREYLMNRVFQARRLVFFNMLNLSSFNYEVNQLIHASRPLKERWFQFSLYLWRPEALLQEDFIVRELALKGMFPLRATLYALELAVCGTC